ncbi:hypothetical protein KsCSTR_02160 [Candidatus Kuenenia stuttgartiensis]|uniref:Uncharacterized protein n=1 Tax=Kuenenia stuttgartiensis TaxID=174633 RepID=A0A6G7GJ96_KUEST|nr:hypothetical protein KsCSTR_02160 [Candidatus Kuenenia stuttgartiensis]
MWIEYLHKCKPQFLVTVNKFDFHPCYPIPLFFALFASLRET